MPWGQPGNYLSFVQVLERIVFIKPVLKMLLRKRPFVFHRVPWDCLPMGHCIVFDIQEKKDSATRTTHKRMAVVVAHDYVCSALFNASGAFCDAEYALVSTRDLYETSISD